MNKPTRELLHAAHRVLQYLHSTASYGLRYARESEFKLVGWSDSDWQVRCSTSGYVFLMACAAVSYLSKKQPTIAMASTQSEIYAASLAGLEATFLVGMGEQITGRKLAPVDLDTDNKGAFDMAHDFVSNSRVRHYERRALKIRELVENGLIKLKQVRTDENPSDIFTKALGKRLFEKYRKVLLNM